ncbi:hypothetical protein [Euzebya rosea]|uniref:hypothetical protein n=1 Tax=Euzebya rosea TaxID=2052804 RepID=UPI0013006AA8|nr:hypothetical protein [Euzebya rosea]
MTLQRVFVTMTVVALAFLAVPAATGQPIERRGPEETESRGLDAGGGEEAAEEEQVSRFDDQAFADQVILDDLIVDGSACVGFDCVNGESFGFDTIRLKENNLRIRFFDTSTSASFPSNDWQITVNDSTNGGANKFSIDDIDGGRTPFTIEAGAPSHSLYVDDGGRIGLGTSTPVVEVHLKDGDTPTVRLEQDGSSGFTAQTWDMAGNETNFFIRDVTNGSRLPLRIRPNAPSNSIYVDADGDIGMGTSSPEAPLDVARNGLVYMRLTNTETGGDDWQFATRQTGFALGSGELADGLIIRRIGADASPELRLTPDGALVLHNGAAPVGPVAGAMYFDGDTFCGYDGTTWHPLQAAGDQTCS